MLDRHCHPAGSCHSLNVFQVHFGRSPRLVGAAGILPPGGCWQSSACNSCWPPLQLGTGKAGREPSATARAGAPTSGKAAAPRAATFGGAAGAPDKGSCLHGSAAGTWGTGGVLAARAGAFPGTPLGRTSTIARCSPALGEPVPLAQRGRGGRGCRRCSNKAQLRPGRRSHLSCPFPPLWGHCGVGHVTRGV